MKPPPHAQSLLGDHLAQLSRTKEGRDALDRFSTAGIDVDGIGDLCALVHQWDGRGGGKRRDRMLEDLAALAPDDHIAALCAVVALRPELTRMARQLEGRGLDAEEAHSEVVALAWACLTEPVGSIPCAAQPGGVVNAIWNAARRSPVMGRRMVVDLVPLVEGLDAGAPDVDRLERWPGLLAAAVARGVLTPRQMVVIAQTRMEGRPLAEVARALGRGYDAVQKDRRRGEAALRTFAADYALSESG